MHCMSDARRDARIAYNPKEAVHLDAVERRLLLISSTGELLNCMEPKNRPPCCVFQQLAFVNTNRTNWLMRRFGLYVTVESVVQDHCGFPSPPTTTRDYLEWRLPIRATDLDGPTSG
jgi:hypothetical protein